FVSCSGTAGKTCATLNWCWHFEGGIGMQVGHPFEPTGPGVVPAGHGGHGLTCPHSGPHGTKNGTHTDTGKQSVSEWQWMPVMVRLLVGVLATGLAFVKNANVNVAEF